MLGSEHLLFKMWFFLPFQMKTFKQSWKRTSRWAQMPRGNTHSQFLSKILSVMFCKGKYRFTFQLYIFYINILWPRGKCSCLPNCSKVRCTDAPVKRNPRQHIPLHQLCVSLPWKTGRPWEFLLQVLSHTGLKRTCFAPSPTSHLWFVQFSGWMYCFTIWKILQCQRKERPLLECENCIIVIFEKWIMFQAEFANALLRRIADLKFIWKLPGCWAGKEKNLWLSV